MSGPHWGLPVHVQLLQSRCLFTFLQRTTHHSRHQTTTPLTPHRVTDGNLELLKEQIYVGHRGHRSGCLIGGQTSDIDPNIQIIVGFQIPSWSALCLLVNPLPFPSDLKPNNCQKSQWMDENILPRSLPESKDAVQHVKFTYCSLKNQFWRISFLPLGPFLQIIRNYVVLKHKWGSCCRQNVFQGVFKTVIREIKDTQKGKKVQFHLKLRGNQSNSELVTTRRFLFPQTSDFTFLLADGEDEEKQGWGEKRWKTTTTTSWLWL